MNYFDQKAIKDLLRRIKQYPEDYAIIHYACESLSEPKGNNLPRITSIAVYLCESRQVETFSLCDTMNTHNEDASEEYYDSLERDMLTRFFSFAERHNMRSWIHWNMRDNTFGFKALESRYTKLGGSPYTIPDRNKIDLSDLLMQLYGDNYIDNPRLEHLIKLNRITDKNFLRGEEEAKAYKNHELIKIKQSTQRKVTAIYDILSKTINGSLLIKQSDLKWYIKIWNVLKHIPSSVKLFFEYIKLSEIFLQN